MSPAIPPIGGAQPGSQLLAVQQKLSQATADLQLKAGITAGPASLNPMDRTGSLPGQFGQVMMNSLGQVNEVVKKPDALLEEYMRGGPVDIHDVMIAGQESELAVSMASRIITKAIQAYERISQIQV